MKKLIITGAAGEAGFNLIQILTTEKNNPAYGIYRIIAIDKNRDNCKLLKKLFPTIKVVVADLAIPGPWVKEFKDAYAVVQLQAQISSNIAEVYERNNVTTVINVLEACMQYNITRMVYASSSVVRTKSQDLYTITKRKAEQIVQKSKVPHITLRQTLMYGCFDVKHVGYLATFFDKSPIFPMPGSGKYIRQPIYVKDYCRIIINAIDTPMDNKVYDITGKEKVYLKDMLKLYATQLKKKVLIIPIPIPIFDVMIRVYNLFNKNTRIMPSQLYALTAGDVFPEFDWEKKFKVKATPLIQGVKEMAQSKYLKYQKQMTRSNT